MCSETSDKQWHSSEILSELSERVVGGFDGLDKYVLGIALAESKMLSPFGKMTWAQAGQDTDDRTRIDIQQAVIAIVKAAGRPLSTGEIKERLTALRGVNEFFQIVPVDPLIRIQPGIWGINDRDVPLSRGEQAELVEELNSDPGRKAARHSRKRAIRLVAPEGLSARCAPLPYRAGRAVAGLEGPIRLSCWMG